jgi:hypothetical protein
VFNSTVFTSGVRLQRCLPVLAASVVLLGGCGVAGTELHPGVAAQVGDDSVSVKHVDQVTDDACQGLEKLDEGGSNPSTPTPLGALARQVTTTLVERMVAEQLAQDYDVTTTADYKTNLAQAEAQLSTLSGDQADAVQEVVEAQAYAQDVLVQIGAAALEKQGQDDSAPQDQYDEGLKIADAWADDHDVDINPKYALELGTEGPVDTGLSWAVSKNATEGQAAEPAADYVASLPDDLVCFD